MNSLNNRNQIFTYLLLLLFVLGLSSSSNTFALNSFSITPGNATLCEGDSISFSLTLTSTQNLSFQWLYNSIIITNATDSVFTINSLSPSDAGDYSCIVTDSTGSYPSNNVATLVVNLLPVAIAGIDKTICFESNTLIGSSGVPGYQYIWSPFSGLC